MTGMRRKEKEIHDTERIEAIISNAQVCRLGLCDNGSPYIVPVCFGYEPGFLWIHSAREGRKIDILNANPCVCFEMDNVVGIVRADDPCRWGMRYQSVIGYGRAEFVKNPEEKVHGLACIMSRYADKRPSSPPPMRLDNVCLIRIRITDVTGKNSV